MALTQFLTRFQIELFISPICISPLTTYFVLEFAFLIWKVTTDKETKLILAHSSWFPTNCLFQSSTNKGLHLNTIRKIHHTYFTFMFIFSKKNENVYNDFHIWTFIPRATILSLFYTLSCLAICNHNRLQKSGTLVSFR